MAKMLIDSMSAETVAPEKYHDTYREDVMAMIEARAAGKEIPAGEPVRASASNVVNLMDVLQRSLEASGKRPPASGESAAAGDDETAAKSTGSRKKASAAKPRRKKSAA
jgi:DNA end-binding protein Ku